MRPGSRTRLLVPFLAAALAMPLASCSVMFPACAPTLRVAPARIDVRSFRYAPFRNGRRVWVFVPPGYDRAVARYPVLYMLDGQSLFGPTSAWRVDQSAEWLIEHGEIAPLIIVAIENARRERTFEYTPWPNHAHHPPGGGGEAFLRAVEDTLIPEVARRYRTLPGRANTWIAGASYGGLMAAYAGIVHGGTFGRVAALSPSYAWDHAKLLAIADRARGPRIDRFYQDAGTGRPPPGLHWLRDVSIPRLREMAAIATAHGLTPGRDLLSVEAEGALHNPGCWGHRFPDVLRFLDAAAPAGSTKSPGIAEQPASAH